MYYGISGGNCWYFYSDKPFMRVENVKSVDELIDESHGINVRWNPK